jgi:hypothetical protein
MEATAHVSGKYGRATSIFFLVKNLKKVVSPYFTFILQLNHFKIID